MAERVSVDDVSLAARGGGAPVMALRTSDFDYPLDDRLIAQRPLADRDASRLLHVQRRDEALADLSFIDIVSLVAPGDVLVLNDTRVFPARLLGRKPSGAAAEILLLDRLDDEGLRWRALVRPGGKLKPGRVVEVGSQLEVAIEDSAEAGVRIVRLDTPLTPDEAIARYGHVPLPPYIRRPDDESDRARYQTVYARWTGSVAAPTAGLHFSDRVLESLRVRGVLTTLITLHVGPGTFRPVEVEDPAAHRLPAESYRVTPQSAETINRCRAAGGAIWAVGTTTVRTLESVSGDDGAVKAGSGMTDLFIRPGYRFKVVDRLLTNFHLPRSTLLMLVAAFTGRDLTLEAYRHAARAGYRFYSYGDAMVVT